MAGMDMAGMDMAGMESMQQPVIETAVAVQEPPPPIMDLATDDIPSFAHLRVERGKIFERRTSFESFARNVAHMGETGEEGRRRGLGMWMIGDLEGAAEQLQSYADDDVASFTLANALIASGHAAEAVPVFKRLSEKYPEERGPRGGWLEASLEADLATGDDEAAASNLRTALESVPAAFSESAEAHYLRGRASEIEHSYQAAIDSYMAAREVDGTHRGNLFHLAFLAERTGLDPLALECYQTLTRMLPARASVLMNLGMLYEDMGRDQEAAACYDTVCRSRPADRRARLFLEDAVAGLAMFYAEDLEKKEDRLNQILRIPITDFELSVRARNCLNKMDIMTLGDLVKKTETELLSYKNFGETSLTEIKEILGSKGLRLGMAREEAVASIAKTRTMEPQTVDLNDPLNKPVSELKLSIRARRTVENLGCLTLADITQHSEDELLGMPNFGVTSLLELRSKLSEYGLSLKGEG